MCALGIQTANYHLDNLQQPAEPNEFNWDSFERWATGTNPPWNGGSLPSFAGRYFVGGKFLWGNGEGTAAQVRVPTLERVAPLQAADASRQSAAQDPIAAIVYGYMDANAICARLAASLRAQELSVTASFAHVFLDVAPGDLSPVYWRTWAHHVASFSVPGPAGPVQPFLPAMCCDFVEDPVTHAYTLSPGVKACLDVAQVGSHFEARCYGFWAKAASMTNLDQPLDWTRFSVYQQPMSATSTKSVHVLVWRYAQQSDPPDPAFAGGNVVSLDATHEPDPATSFVLHHMLHIENWTITLAQGLDNGIDVGADITAEAQCLGDPATVISVDPQQVKFGKRVHPGDNHPAWPGCPRFVMRYYCHLGTAKLLRPSELTKLLDNGLRVGVVWEIWDYFTYLTTPGQAFADAVEAFTYAANIIGQPAHTPVYFAFELEPHGGDPTDPADPLVRPALETYFSEVLRGYEQYRVNTGPDPVPYSIGAYGKSVILGYAYKQGIASYFWQAVDPSPNGQNAVAWQHSSLWQVNQDLPTPCGFNADFDRSWIDQGAWRP